MLPVDALLYAIEELPRTIGVTSSQQMTADVMMPPTEENGSAWDSSAVVMRPVEIQASHPYQRQAAV